jgi:hypothetical protein
VKCRHCGELLSEILADLGSAPPSNAYLTAQKLKQPEKWFPLRVLVCSHCRLVQTEDFTDAGQLFDAEYAYFSGFSTSWLAHCERYADAMQARFGLREGSCIVEVATNDGSLLSFFHDRNIRSLGIEPTASTAVVARSRGLDVVEAFFGATLAESLVERGVRADLMAANNVLAHVPDINDFVAGFTTLLADQGVATFEFPHLLNLMRKHQFDTIYHEHYSYLSLLAVERIFATNGLIVFDVEKLPTHGGSLRVFAQRTATGKHPITAAVERLRAAEADAGMDTSTFYRNFQVVAESVKDDFLRFLLQARQDGKIVAAYGAAAKGNTLINFAGVRQDLIAFVVDRNPYKQGRFLPGSRIPIVSEERLREARPDYVVLLPWNLCDELVGQLAYVADWGGRFVTAVPSLQLHNS